MSKKYWNINRIRDYKGDDLYSECIKYNIHNSFLGLNFINVVNIYRKNKIVYSNNYDNKKDVEKLFEYVKISNITYSNIDMRIC